MTRRDFVKVLQDLISKMTLEEKASLCSGLDFWHTRPISRLDIPSIMVTDGPHGLRKQASESDHLGLSDSVPATCFPTASALAATWNRDLVKEVGIALGEECRQEKVGVILGPGANIKRTPLCGRNFEYFSEDPYLSGEIAKSHIQGVQSQGIGTSLKHYAVNNQEFRRMTMDAVVDERALHEIYLSGYEIAVRGAQPWTVMCAYNRLNGTYCCENPFLLTETLKARWGHEGLVVTDWGAMNERVPALKAGLALEMPGPSDSNCALIVDAVQSGELAGAVLDQAVARILRVVFMAADTLAEDFTYDAEAHHALARRAAGEGAVLLKNEGPALPIKKGARVTLLGAFAKTPRYQGAGSSIINPSRLDTLYEELVRLAGEEQITYAPGYGLRDVEANPPLIDEALAAVEGADVVVINAGLPDVFEVEGVDRPHLQLPESHNKLIEAVAAVHDRVVVVLSNGAPVEMPWVEDVQAVLEGYLGGQAGAGGVADILYGVVNPSGKLAETFPLRLEDTPTHAYYPGGPKVVAYRESLYVGYRFYESVGKAVLFPFGHGLSYTTFDYSDLTLSAEALDGGESLTLRLKVKNIGEVAGQEVVQVYVSPQSPTAFRPELELKGFEKVALQPGEAKEVTMELPPRAFAFFNTGLQDWQMEAGAYEIRVGASSRDIRLRQMVAIRQTTPEAPIPERDQLSAYVNFPADAAVSRIDFETLLGRPLPSNVYEKGEPFDINTPIADMQRSFVARQMGKIMRKQAEGLIDDDPDSPNGQMIQAAMSEAPLRMLLMWGGDQLNRGMVDGLLQMINRRFFKGLGMLLQNRSKKKEK
jgi:beta-glucosidase